MALFDNFEFGLTPEFKTSPEVVKMDFFTDLSPLASMITASSNIPKMVSKERNSNGLMNEKMVLDSIKDDIDTRKQGLINTYMNKAKDIQKSNPNLSLSEIFSSLGTQMEKDVLQLKSDEIRYESWNDLAKRNVDAKTKDMGDENKVNNYTFIPSEQGGYTVVGFDKNGNPTADRNKIDKALKGGQYIALQEKVHAPGTAYVPMIGFDPDASEKFITEALGAASAHSKVVGWDNEGGIMENSSIGKFQQSSTSTTQSDNYQQVLAAVDYLNSPAIPQKAMMALENEFLEQRTRGTKFDMTYTDKDKKQKVRTLDFADENYNKAFNDYITYKIGKRKNMYFEDSNVTRKDTKYIDNGGDGNGNWDINTVQGFWTKWAFGTNDVFGDRALVTNLQENPNEFTEVEKKVINTFETIKNNFAKQKYNSYLKNMSPEEAQRRALIDLENGINDGSIAKQAMIDSKIPFTETTLDGLLKSNALKGFIGTTKEVVPFLDRKTERAFWSKDIKTLKYGMSKNQMLTNFGMSVKESGDPGEHAIGLAAPGSRVTYTAYSEGMNPIPEEVSKRMRVISSGKGYLGLLRRDNKGNVKTDQVLEQRVMMPEEDLEKLVASVFENNKYKNVNYDDNDVRDALGVKDIKPDIIKKMVEDYSGNVADADFYSDLINVGKRGWVEVTIKQDFNQAALNLSKQTKSAKDKLPNQPISESGNTWGSTVPTSGK